MPNKKSSKSGAQKRSTTVKKRITKKATKKTRAKKPPAALRFVKSKENPIISPKPENEWEGWQTFNPGVILLGDKVHLFYRAIGNDGISRLGYAVSGDGFTIDERLPYSVYEHGVKQPVFNVYSFVSGGSFGGCEDPRLVRVNGEDRIYMTYTACNEGLRVGLTSIKVEDFLNKKWKWRTPKIISRPGEVHKNWVIFPEKINGKYAILHSISPEISVDYVDSLDFKKGEYIDSCYGNENRKNCWDNWMRGAGAPPIRTKRGWLLFYHAMDKNDPGKYKVGAMLLDLNYPEKVVCRSEYPVLEPEEVYENDGFKAGVVYASGAVVKDGDIYIYYGAADSYIGVAYANLEKFLEELCGKAKSALRRKILRKKITK